MKQDKNLIVVTGGTKGIGKAIVGRFAEAGHAVATCARSEDDLDELKAYITDKYSTKLLVQVSDLSTKEGVDGFLEFLRLTGREIEVLVNNTGKFVPGTVHDEPEGALEDMISTNLYSAYHMTRGVVSGMIKRKKGHIFNMCSTASIMSYPNGGSYCIAKHALHGMSKVLREELKTHNIRVTSVLPGATFTSSWDGVDLPENRLMPPEDIAEMVYSAYKLSPRSVVEDILIRPQLGDL